MLDLLFILALLGFFICAILYVAGCEWLINEQDKIAPAERIETTGQRAGQPGV